MNYYDFEKMFYSILNRKSLLNQHDRLSAIIQTVNEIKNAYPEETDAFIDQISKTIDQTFTRPGVEL